MNGSHLGWEIRNPSDNSIIGMKDFYLGRKISTWDEGYKNRNDALFTVNEWFTSKWQIPNFNLLLRN